MEGKMEINYNWKCDQLIYIPQKHEEALKEDAESRIFEMIKEGYYQGELNTSVRRGKDIVPEEDEDEGLTYSGWWSVIIKHEYEKEELGKYEPKKFETYLLEKLAEIRVSKG